MLVTAATAATGGLSRGLAAPPSSLAGLGVALSATVLVLVLALALRVLVRLDAPGTYGRRSM